MLALLAWLSDDLRLLIGLLGSYASRVDVDDLIKKEWPVARRAATFMGRLFIVSWLMLLFAILWVSDATGHWQLSLALAENSLMLN